MKSLKFSCTDELRDWIRRQAEAEGISESAVIRRALLQAKREDD